MCKARRWLDAPRGTEGMFAEFREESKGMRQVLTSSVNEGEGQGVGATTGEGGGGLVCGDLGVLREKARETGLAFTGRKTGRVGKEYEGGETGRSMKAFGHRTRGHRRGSMVIRREWWRLSR